MPVRAGLPESHLRVVIVPPPKPRQAAVLAARTLRTVGRGSPGGPGIARGSHLFSIGSSWPSRCDWQATKMGLPEMPGDTPDVVWDILEYVLRHRSEEHTSELQSLRHLVCRL